MQGYIKIYRKMMCSPIWQDPEMFRLWMYCLMKASHKEHSVIVDKQEVKLNIGEFVTGRFKLHQEFNNGIPPRKHVKDTTLWSWLKKLEKMGNIDIKTYNKYSVVSIVNWVEYQVTLTTEQQQNDNSLTTEQQQNDTYKNVKNDKNDKKNKRHKQVYDESSIYYQLAVFFFERILENNPEYKEPNLQTWSGDIRKMIEIDKRTEEQVRYLMKWVQEDDFEKVNVLSPVKLRKRFDGLVMKVKQQKEKKQKPKEINWEDI